MDPVEARIEAIARKAMDRLEAAQEPWTAPASSKGLRIGTIEMPQLARLVYLQAGDPLVDEVLASLKTGRPVFLDRPAIEASLGFAAYPPRLQEQFNRWFSRLAGYGIALVGHSARAATPPHRETQERHLPPAEPRQPTPPSLHPSPSSSSISRPEEAIFSEILGEAVAEAHPCVKEPGRSCCGSGRCKTLGY